MINEMIMINELIIMMIIIMNNDINEWWNDNDSNDK